MSQSNKRSAEAAFEDSAEHKSQVRKKRNRHRGGEKTESPSKEKKLVAAEAPTHHKSKHPRDTGSKSRGKKNLRIPTQSTVDANNQTEALALAKRSKKHKKTARSLKSDNDSHTIVNQSKRTNSWTISPATGGVFIDHDPILTADGQYMILLTKEYVNVYSTATSLLVRCTLIKERHTISACSLSLTESNVLYVTTKEGVLVKLDISTGSKLGQWQVDVGIRKITSVTSDGSVDSLVAIRTVEERGNELCLLSFRVAAKAESRVLLRNRRFIHTVRASSDASIITVCSSQGVHVGVRSSLENTKYTWYVFGVVGTIVSFDVKITKKEKASDSRPGSVDIVVGLNNGAIFVFEDVAEKLINKAKAGHKTDLSGRKLHWHRTAVQSVKWSEDGNYIISGGDETVLVIWQLDTNQQQFLPHLSTAICNIVVSTSGAQYAIRLGDNSVMILATADLTPSTNVTGLSLPVHSNRRFQMELHPMHSNQLLAAVPIRHTKAASNQSATHLQTYDIDTNLQLNRQALTRNVTTTINVAPDGQPLQEPDIIHMKISSDGHWLATLETWCPNQSDTQALYPEEDQAAQDKAMETTLRFWRWDVDQSTWEIITRIDKPYADGHSFVLSLASNPVAPEFSTIGSDGSVNVWQPSKRVRDGVQVRNKAGQPLFTWSCAKSIHIEKIKPEPQQSAVLTYSEDGTMIMASWSRKQRYIHLVDRSAGTLCMSLPNLLNEGPAQLETTGRYLLCLSTDFRILDMITLQTTFAMDVKSNTASFLALNPRSNCFAIGLNSQEGIPGVVSVFDIENLEQGSMTDFKLPVHIHALLADPAERGFVIVDDDCKIRKLLPPGTLSTTSSALIPANYKIDEVSKSLEDIFGHDRMGENIAGRPQQRLIEDVPGSRNLADLVSATSTAAQPAVGELFDIVARAVGGVQINVGA